MHKHQESAGSREVYIGATPGPELQITPQLGQESARAPLPQGEQPPLPCTHRCCTHAGTGGRPGAGSPSDHNASSHVSWSRSSPTPLHSSACGSPGSKHGSTHPAPARGHWLQSRHITLGSQQDPREVVSALCSGRMPAHGPNGLQQHPELQDLDISNIC